MLSATVTALACLCLARTSPAEPYNLRLYSQSLHNPKDVNNILANIEERLRALDSISAAQAKQARNLEVIQDRLDRVETTLTLKLERAQLAAERLEHRLHMLQVNIQATIKENSEKLERSEEKIARLTQNLTNHIDTHTHLLEKVNGAYTDTWHRGLVLESLMRDGLSLVNVTRRELADGLRALARRQRDTRLTSADLEVNFAKWLNENTYKIDMKMQEVLDVQKRFIDSCQRIQHDDPNHIADVLDKLIDSLINKTASTFHELQSIQVTMRNHDNRVMKFLSTIRTPQIDPTCRRLESVIRNSSNTVFKENELRQLTEKFVALTDRADAALQRLEAQLADDPEEPTMHSSEITEEADKLLNRLKEYENQQESNEGFNWEDEGYYDDGGGGGGNDMMDEDKNILTQVIKKNTVTIRTGSETTRPPHRRHLHKHPYDRGPISRSPSTS